MKQTLSIFVCACFLLACKSENEEDLFAPEPIVPKDTTSGLTVSFQSQIQPLISMNCATSGCHAANAQFPTLETYNQINNSKDRVNARVSAGTMPPSGPLQQSDKDLIQTWINEGARNN